MTQALVSNDKRAWEAHRKKKEREREFDTLKKKVAHLENVVEELSLYIKERAQ